MSVEVNRGKRTPVAGSFVATMRSGHESSTEYRQRGPNLLRLIGDPEELGRMPGGRDLTRILQQRSDALAPCGQELVTLSQRGVLGWDVKTLWRSYVHLHCNRLLAASSQHEQVLLGLLFGVHESLVRAPVHR